MRFEKFMTSVADFFARDARSFYNSEGIKTNEFATEPETE